MTSELLLFAGSVLTILLIGILVGVLVMATAKGLVRERDANASEAKEKIETILTKTGFSPESVKLIVTEIDRSGVQLQLKGRNDHA